MVPALNVAGCGELASLEFAVCALITPHMIVCDHSKCDAIKACLSPETVQGFDPLPGWIGNGMKGLNELEPTKDFNLVKMQENLAFTVGSMTLQADP